MPTVALNSGRASLGNEAGGLLNSDQLHEPSITASALPFRDWRNCFNTSTSRATYAQRLYGAEAASESPDGFTWTNVSVLYPHLLRGQLNGTCFGKADRAYRRSMLGGFFVDYVERRNTVNGDLINRGGPRLPPQIVRWPWTEVMHSNHHGLTSMQGGVGQGNLWMYVARGSGLWFDPGLVLEFSDTVDLAIYLNTSSSDYHPRSVDQKVKLFASATKRLAMHVDSIALKYHVDGGCCHRMVMRELVSLHNFTHQCPASMMMRRGWPPDHLRTCECGGGVVC